MLRYSVNPAWIVVEYVDSGTRTQAHSFINLNKSYIKTDANNLMKIDLASWDPKCVRWLDKSLFWFVKQNIFKSGIAPNWWNMMLRETDLITNWLYSRQYVTLNFVNLPNDLSSHFKELKNPFFNTQLIFSDTQELNSVPPRWLRYARARSQKKRVKTEAAKARQATLCSPFYRLAPWAQYYVTLSALRHHPKPTQEAIRCRRQTTHAMFNLFYKRVQTVWYVLRETYMPTNWAPKHQMCKSPNKPGH